MVEKNMTFLRRRRKDDIVPANNSGLAPKKKWSPSPKPFNNKPSSRTTRQERPQQEKKTFVRKSYSPQLQNLGPEFSNNNVEQMLSRQIPGDFEPSLLVVLDRDGVINKDSDEYIKSPQEWEPLDGSLDAIVALNDAGFKVVVATNQSGIARGYFDLPTLRAIHDKMLQSTANRGGIIDRIYFCPHAPEDNCECRKPKIGMLTQIAKDYQVNLQNVVLIGDKYSDIQAGLNAGCKCILVLTGKGKETLEKYQLHKSVMVAKNLEDAADMIISLT